MKKLGLIIFLVSLSLVLAGCSRLLGDRKNAGLQVLTGGQTSSVFLDDQYLDKTPLIERDIKPGTYTLRIQPDDNNLVPHETTVNLRGGLLTVVTWDPGERPEMSGGVIYEMEPIGNKNDTELVFVSIPDGVIISVDGFQAEFTPTVLKNIPAGHLAYEATLPSYVTQSHTINVVPGHRMLINIKLAKMGDTPPTPPRPPDDQDQDAIDEDLSTDDEVDTLVSETEDEIDLEPPYVIILSTGFRQEDQEVLRVRDEPGVGGRELGFVPEGSQHPYLGETEAGWHQIKFGDESGWVSGEYTQLITQ